jgi:hypothetical protein
MAGSITGARTGLVSAPVGWFKVEGLSVAGAPRKSGRCG